MEDVLFLLLFVLIVWLVIYLFLEFNIVNKKRKNVKRLFLEMDNLFMKRFHLLNKMVDVVKAYDKNQFDEFGSRLYDYINSYDDYEYNKRLEVNEYINNEIKKILLVRKVYPELNENVKYIKLEKQLIRLNKVLNKYQLKYNKALRDYISRKKIFPSELICVLCRFYSYNYFNLKK